MKTMTDEVDAPAQTKTRTLKWYAVRPALLSVLIAEVLTAVGLVAMDPKTVWYWLDRAAAGVTIGIAQIEVVLLALAGLVLLMVAMRARRGESVRGVRWFRRADAQRLTNEAVC